MSQPTDYLEQPFRRYKQGQEAQAPNPETLEELLNAIDQATSTAEPVYIVGIPKVEYHHDEDGRRPYWKDVPFVLLKNLMMAHSTQDLVIAATAFDEVPPPSSDAPYAYGFDFADIRDLSLHSTRVEMGRQLWALYPEGERLHRPTPPLEKSDDS